MNLPSRTFLCPPAPFCASATLTGPPRGTLLPPSHGAPGGWSRLPRQLLRVDIKRQFCHSEFLESRSYRTRRTGGEQKWLVNAGCFSGRFLELGAGEQSMQTTPNSVSWFMLSLEPGMEALPNDSRLPVTYASSRGNKEKQLPCCDILPSLQSHLHLRLLATEITSQTLNIS